MLSSKKLVLFDLDGTLAPSKGAISPSMAEALHLLLTQSHVAVITGGTWIQCKKQVVDRLHEETKQHFDKLHILPTAGTRYYAYGEDEWNEMYSETIEADERQRIIDLLHKETEGEYDMTEMYGDLVEDRGSQITLSAKGQQAPLHVKETFDPDQAIRKRIVEKLVNQLSEYDIRIGGATSIDITKKGMDKGFGITKIKDHLGFTLDELGYVGDAVFEGGNDYPAKLLGVHTIQVASPEETESHIRSWIK